MEPENRNMSTCVMEQLVCLLEAQMLNLSQSISFSPQGNLHHWLQHHRWWCEGSTDQNQEFGQVQHRLPLLGFT